MHPDLQPHFHRVPHEIPSPTRHHLIVKTVVASLVVIATNVIASYALARGMRDVGTLESWSPLPYIRAFSRPWVAFGVFFMLAWFTSRLALLSWTDLSYALPVTSFSYALAALAGQLYLHEEVTPIHWAGILIISVGVALVALTYPETVEASPEALTAPEREQ